MNLLDKYEKGEYVSPTQWAKRVYELEKALLKVEELIFRNFDIPVNVREEIQEKIIVEVGLTPKPKSR